MLFTLLLDPSHHPDQPVEVIASEVHQLFGAGFGWTCPALEVRKCQPCAACRKPLCFRPLHGLP